jgi:hypothetical protein
MTEDPACDFVDSHAAYNSNSPLRVAFLAIATLDTQLCHAAAFDPRAHS